MPEPIAPAATPPAPDPALTAISETLSKLSGAIDGLGERLNGFEEQMTALTPPADPNPPVDQPKWKPKDWDEFPVLAEQVATQVIEKREAERIKQESDQVEQANKIKDQIDADFANQLTQLEKSGVIPAGDAAKGVRNELFAIGIKYGSSDLIKMSEMRTDYSKAGYKFNIVKPENGVGIDPEKSGWIKSNPTPYGQFAPVASSSHVSTNKAQPSYKEIHNLSMDQMARRFSE